MRVFHTAKDGKKLGSASLVNLFGFLAAVCNQINYGVLCILFI